MLRRQGDAIRLCAAALLLAVASAAHGASFKVKPEKSDADCDRGRACVTRDITTPARDTRICTRLPAIWHWHSNWGFRQNRYYYHLGRKTIMERSGDVAYTNDCKFFKKSKTLVEGKYALTEGFPLVTYSGDLCAESVTLEVHRNPYDDRLMKIRTFREQAGYSEQATAHLKRSYGEHVDILYDPAAIFYIGHYRLNGLINDPANAALRASLRVIEQDCGRVPTEVRVKGILSKPKRKVGTNRFAGEPDFEEIYSGRFVNGRTLEHDNQEVAEALIAWADAEQRKQQDATARAVFERERRLQLAKEGAAYVFIALFGIYKNSPCNDKELCEIYKPTDCVAPPC